MNISESVWEHYAFQNVEVNIDDVSKNPHEKAISDKDDANELTNCSSRDLAEELPETVTFCGQGKRVSEFEKYLANVSRRWVYRFVFYAICYAICYKKNRKSRSV